MRENLSRRASDRTSEFAPVLVSRAFRELFLEIDQSKPSNWRQCEPVLLDRNGSARHAWHTELRVPLINERELVVRESSWAVDPVACLRAGTVIDLTVQKKGVRFWDSNGILTPLKARPYLAT